MRITWGDFLWGISIVFAVIVLLAVVVVVVFFPAPSEDKDAAALDARPNFIHEIRALYPSDDYRWLVYHNDLACWNGEDLIPTRPRLSSKGF